MPADRLFWESWDSISVGTIEANYDFEVVDPGWILQVESIAVYNAHASQTLDLYFGLVTAGAYRRIEGVKALAALDVFERRRPVYIKEGDFLRVAVKGSGPATTGEIYVQGWLVSTKEEE